jgi:hypothetical protein
MFTETSIKAPRNIANELLASGVAVFEENGSVWLDTDKLTAKDAKELYQEMKANFPKRRNLYGMAKDLMIVKEM